MADDQSRFLTPRLVFGSLGVYFLLQIISRVLVSDSLQMDEAEQLVLGQEWALGYGSQPPLYTWLQIPVFKVFGMGVFALALLKNTLLFGTYVFFYRAAREIFDRQDVCLLATLSLLLIPGFAWESQRDQTHLVLASMCSAATVYAFLRLLKTQAPVWYLGFGIAAGCGILAKYNYAFLPAALLIAGASLASTRAAVLNRKMLLVPLAFLLVSGPHWLWAWNDSAVMLAQKGNFRMHQENAFASRARGLLSVIKATASYILPTVAIYLLVFWRGLRGRSEFPVAPMLQMLRRALVVAVSLCGILTLVFAVTNVRSRWMQPLLLATPLLLIGWAQPLLTPQRIRILTSLALASAIAVFVAVNGTVIAAGLIRKTHNLNAPYAELSSQLRKAGFNEGCILAEDKMLGGNLKLQFVESTVVTPEMAHVTIPNDRTRLIIWHVREGQPEPQWFLDVAGTLSRVSPSAFERRYVSAPTHHQEKKVEKLGFTMLQRSSSLAVRR